MEAYLQHLVAQSVGFALIIVAVVAFFESLALVGLILPGTVMMATLGTLIGSGQVGLYEAWLAAGLGCFLGDWASYFIGRGFKEPLHRWRFLQRYQSLLDKTGYALDRHSFATVILGRFIGPTRPLVPLVAGMLNLPPYKFAPPNIVGCITWPPVYFLPGILAGVAIDIPASHNSGVFKWLLFISVMLIWLSAWLAWRWFRAGKGSPDMMTKWLPLTRLRVVCVLSVVATVVSIVMLSKQPMMPVYGHLLWKVITR
ncbi:MAG: DedA family protein [Rahnella inusitata]|jgi:membrane protein DedA with SNARE-associated domain|uniref:DedA family protein n=1 Tax=Rahnella inusitata TaxID=58169 RepID=A0ABX9P157_9GAMM|nr:DedA family protein [Rahnella inusitata]NMC24083.1 DedA family protein [Serratia sp. (in: enterobacteria)]QUT14964.1 DedA family protein [Rahnella inusitata]RJT13978.1 DedA family protein [Rahnella inusitata]